ncbi:uncharacterized protein VICG_00240, partial [Vittaforma corneae ATCC 50505]
EAFVFNFHRNMLLQTQKIKEACSQMLESKAANIGSSQFNSPELLKTREMVAKNIIEHYQRKIFKFDDSPNPSEYLLFNGSCTIAKLVARFFDFMMILYAFSVESNAQNKECRINGLKTLDVYVMDNSIFGALKRRERYIKSLKSLKILELTDKISLELANPESIVAITIQSSSHVDLRSHNWNWILRHRNLEILSLAPKSLLLLTEGFKKIKEL